MVSTRQSPSDGGTARGARAVTTTVRSGAVVLVGVVTATLTGCAGSAAPPTPSPSAIALTALTPCGADVVVPTDSFGVEPSASTPPTVTVPVGSAVSFAVPAGARVGIVPGGQADDAAQVCAAPSSEAGTQFLVAVAAGYLRVGIQTGTDDPLRVLIKVTG